MTEETFKRRGITAETGVKSITDKYHELSSIPQGEEEEIRICHMKLIKEIENYSFEIQKNDHILSACEADQKSCSVFSESTESQISELKKSIINLQKQLSIEKRRRANEEEYETLAKYVEQTPSRSATSLQIKSVEEDLSELTIGAQTNLLQIENRKKQFYLLMHSIYELQMELGAEHELTSALEHQAQQQQLVTSLSEGINSNRNNNNSNSNSNSNIGKESAETNMQVE